LDFHNIIREVANNHPVATKIVDETLDKLAKVAHQPTEPYANANFDMDQKFVNSFINLTDEE
jgi:urate oxidase